MMFALSAYQRVTFPRYQDDLNDDFLLEMQEMQLWCFLTGMKGCNPQLDPLFLIVPSFLG